MKNIIIINILKCLFICINVTAFSQNLKDFTGIYLLEQRCFSLEYIPTNDTIIPDSVNTQYELKVNIAANDTNDLVMDVKFLLESYSLGFNFINDSTFKVYQHVFPLVYDTQQFFEGAGTFYKDSISINFSRTTTTSSFENNCDCKGKKIRDIDVGIDETELLDKAITLYPNPVNEELKILWPFLSGKTYNNYRIYNLQGKSVLESKSQLYESVNVSSLKQGTYIIHFLKDDVAIVLGRFVKME